MLALLPAARRPQPPAAPARDARLPLRLNTANFCLDVRFPTPKQVCHLLIEIVSDAHRCQQVLLVLSHRLPALIRRARAAAAALHAAAVAEPESAYTPPNMQIQDGTAAHCTFASG